MKKEIEIYLTTVMVIMLALCAAAPVQAQSSSRTTFRTTIPFEFTVGNKTLPAGDYVVVCTNPSSDQTVLQFRRKDGRAFVLVQMHAVFGSAPAQAKLIFNRYGDQHFFSRAWTTNETNGLEAGKSGLERSKQRELARRGKRSESIAVNSR